MYLFRFDKTFKRQISGADPGGVQLLPGGSKITEIQSLSTFKQMLVVSICFNKRYWSPLSFYSIYHIFLFFQGGVEPFKGVRAPWNPPLDPSMYFYDND